MEALKLTVAAVQHRVEALEAGLGRLSARLVRRELAAGRTREVRDLVRELRLPADALEQGRAEHRRRLAEALRGKRWSYQQIAFALGCSERTVERYFAPGKERER